MNTEATGNLEHQGKQTGGTIRSILLPLTALGLALFGQWLLLETDNFLIISALFFLAAISLYLVSLHNWPQSALDPGIEHSLAVSWRPIIRDRAWHALLIAISLSLAALSYLRFSRNALDNGFWPWMGALLLFLTAFIYVPDCNFEDFRSAFANWFRDLDKRVILALTFIMLVATFFRFYRLQDIPLEMTSDHAEKILDVQDVLDGSRPIFFTRNTGRELFQFYLTAGIIRLTGLPNSHLTLKIGTAIFGLAALPFTYLLGRFLYGNLVGLLAVFFLAISHWHVAITRVGLRFPFTAAFATPVLYFLLRALKGNRRNDWLLAGFFLGVGLHTYTAMRIVPVLCLVLIYVKLLIDGIKKYKKAPIDGVDSWTWAFWKNGILMVSLTLLLLTPLIRFMVENPRGVWVRSLSRFQPDSPSSLSELIVRLLENIKNALLMFNYQGDTVAVNTIPGEPVLGLISGAFFLLGLSYLIWRLLKNRDYRSLIMLTSLFILLLPSILSLAFPGENPSVVRSGGAIPVVMIIVAIPLATTLIRLHSSEYRMGALMAIVGAILFFSVALVDNYTWYFHDYDAQYRYSIANATELGAVLKAFEEEGGEVGNAYHVPYPHWVDTRNIGINAGHVRWNNALVDPQTIYDHVFLPRPRLYLLNPNDAQNLQNLQNLFPDGSAERYNSPRVGKDFIIFKVPADSAD
jgi:hypothetical protein